MEHSKFSGYFQLTAAGGMYHFDILAPSEQSAIRKLRHLVRCGTPGKAWAVVAQEGTITTIAVDFLADGKFGLNIVRDSDITIEDLCM